MRSLSHMQSWQSVQRMQVRNFSYRGHVTNGMDGTQLRRQQQWLLAAVATLGGATLAYFAWRRVAGRTALPSTPVSADQVNQELDQDQQELDQERLEVDNITSDSHRKLPKQPFVSVLVIFGTNTGTAELFARQVSEKLAEAPNSPSCEVIDAAETSLDAILAKDLARCLVVFIVASHGEGEFTDNFRRFAKALRKVPRGSLEKQLRYAAVFGLGSRNYEHFNAAARKTVRLLRRAGTSFACRYGEGNDAGDIDADFERWSHEQLMPAVFQTSSSGPCRPVDGPPSHQGTWRALGDAAFERSVLGSSFGPPGELNEFVSAKQRRLDLSLFKVVSRKDLFLKPSATHAMLRLELAPVPGPCHHSNDKLGDPHNNGPPTKECACGAVEQARVAAIAPPAGTAAVAYAPGDAVEILPQQNAALVRAMFERLLLDPATGSRVAWAREASLEWCVQFPGNAVASFPSGSSIFAVLSMYVDLSSGPRRSFLRKLAAAVFGARGVPAALQARVERASRSGDYVRDLFSSEDAGQRFVSLAEFITAFFENECLCPTREAFIALVLALPRLKRRSYSIDSCPREYPTSSSSCPGRGVGLAERLAISVSLSSILRRSFSVDPATGAAAAQAAAGIAAHSCFPIATPARDTPGSFSFSPAVRSVPAASASTVVLGVCSSFLFSPETCHVLARVVPGTLRFDCSSQAPVLFVAAGAGIAPVRAILKEIEAQAERSAADGRARRGLPDEVAVIYGCRDESRCGHGELLRALAAEGEGGSAAPGPAPSVLDRPATNLIVSSEGAAAEKSCRPPVITLLRFAHSRALTGKTYVQDVLFKERKFLEQKIVRASGRVYVCGATRMAQSVRTALQTLVGADTISAMKEEGRFFEEAWDE